MDFDLFIQALLLIVLFKAEMASSSAERSAVTTPVPRFLVELNKVYMKPNNHLPLTIPNGKEYYMEARNFLLSGPAKTALTLNIPGV